MNDFKLSPILNCQNGCGKMYKKEEAITHNMYGNIIYFCSEECKTIWLNK